MWAEQVEPIVRKAGALAQSYFRSNIQGYDKGGGSIVTQADIEVETYLKAALSLIIPGSGFIAEESQRAPAEYTWVIDPIDGTRNFAHGLPYYAISVALVHNNEFLMGMVFDPSREELFWGEKGLGAFCNAKPLDTKNIVRKPVEGLLMATNSFVNTARMENIIQLYQGLKEYNPSLRCTGSAALDLAYAAAGYIDIAVFQYLSWWDIAGGAAIAHHAGLKVTDFQGNNLQENSKGVIIAPAYLYENIKNSL